MTATNEIRSQQSRKTATKEARTMYDKDGLERAQKWAARPPTWAGQLGPVPSHAALCPHSIFYLTFCFEQI
jgi:hypothetical protein